MFKFDHTKFTDTKENVILEEGEAKFYIKKCEQTVSKSGNQMLKLELSASDSSKHQAYVFDYIVGGESFLWKIKHLCEAIGHSEIFELGEISPEFLEGKSGLCLIRIEEDPHYGKQNKIKDYIPSENKGIAAQKPSNSDFEIEDEDLPF